MYREVYVVMDRRGDRVGSGGGRRSLVLHCFVYGNLLQQRVNGNISFAHADVIFYSSFVAR